MLNHLVLLRIFDSTWPNIGINDLILEYFFINPTFKNLIIDGQDKLFKVRLKLKNKEGKINEK